MAGALGGALTRRRRRLLFFAVLAACALPGLALLLRDLFWPGPKGIMERVLRYRSTVEVVAQRHEMDVPLVLAVIAVESRGDPEARSSRGAVGLMQLLPGTARDVAGWIGEPAPAEADLLDPVLNIRLGTAYLREQMDTFGGRVAMALAAYNAGPRRVHEWVDEEPGAPPEEAVLRRAFPVTKRYVSDVLAYRERFAERLRGEAARRE